MGASYGSFNESFSDETQKENSNPIAKVKLGYGVREAYAVEFSLDYTQADSEGTDVARYGMNVDLLKALDFPYVKPLFKAGFGTGYVDVSTQHLTYGSFNLGAGIFVPIGEHFDLEVGYDYKYLSYEREDNTQKLTSNANSVYLGINSRF
jgi:hypothetical protein